MQVPAWILEEMHAHEEVNEKEEGKLGENGERSGTTTTMTPTANAGRTEPVTVIRPTTAALPVVATEAAAGVATEAAAAAAAEEKEAEGPNVFATTTRGREGGTPLFSSSLPPQTGVLPSSSASSFPSSSSPPTRAHGLSVGSLSSSSSSLHRSSFPGLGTAVAAASLPPPPPPPPLPPPLPPPSPPGAGAGTGGSDNTGTRRAPPRRGEEEERAGESLGVGKRRVGGRGGEGKEGDTLRLARVTEEGGRGGGGGEGDEGKGKHREKKNDDHDADDDGDGEQQKEEEGREEEEGGEEEGEEEDVGILEARLRGWMMERERFEQARVEVEGLEAIQEEEQQQQQQQQQQQEASAESSSSSSSSSSPSLAFSILLNGMPPRTNPNTDSNSSNSMSSNSSTTVRRQRTRRQEERLVELRGVLREYEEWQERTLPLIRAVHRKVGQLKLRVSGGRKTTTTTAST